MLTVSAIALALVTSGPPPEAPAVMPGYYVVDTLTRIAADAPPPEGAAHEISLACAANEAEGAQIILYGGAAGLRSVDVRVSVSPEDGAGGRIPAEAIRFYRAHFVAVRSPSGLHGSPGIYPDALVPLRNPFTGGYLEGGLYPAAPFDVAPHRNEAVYVEFFVPPDTAPGTYRGALRIEHQHGTPLAEAPVALRVWAFELSARPALRTNFQSYDSGYEGAARYLGYAIGSAEHRALARALDELLLAHRLTPESPAGTAFDLNEDGSIVPEGAAAQRLLSYLQRPEFGEYLLPFGLRYPFPAPAAQNRSRTLNYLRSVYEWFQAHGLEDKLVLRPGDEPSRARDFLSIRELAELARQASSGYRVAMTVDLTDPRTEAYLAGHVQRLIAGYWSFEPQAAARLLASGHEIWTYTALTQNSAEPSPFWLIDFPLLNYRIAAWINFRYGATGLLYWSSAYWEEAAARRESLWESPCNYRSGSVCYNGEGLLVYPGREVNLVVPQGAYGPDSAAPVYAPLPSLRLKALRDAVEDYEYLAMARAADPAEAERIVLKVACGGDPGANCFHHWNRDARALEQARLELASLIESRRRGFGGAEGRAGNSARPRAGRGR
jgi:hypothetical protein